MGIQTEKKDNSSFIYLEGDVTIAMASELKDAVLKHIAESQYLTINVENVEELDISCIQLLCSANLTSERKNKKIIMKLGKQKDVFKQMMIESGYDPVDGCPESPCKRCLWKGDKT